MKISNFKLQISKLRQGFTMIELLIVIAVLGILAVAVLSAINPIEQINRSRDTGSRSDAEQLLGAIDRFYANQGYYAWQSGATDPTDFAVLTQITPIVPEVTGRAGCTMLETLSSGDETVASCTGSEELKLSFTNRITEADTAGAPKANPLHLYYDGEPGSSVYVCFAPKSGAFKTESQKRCTEGLPADLPTVTICSITLNGVAETYMSCLP
jgi:prepilin-type N-terminal cleavage/methylation domain-containing protein